MKKIKLYSSVSLDGYIARKDGRLDWLESINNPNQIDHDYETFVSGIDVIIMGRKTYDIILSYGIEWPYKGKTSYIVSRSSNLPIQTESTYLLNGDIISKIRELKVMEGKDIWLVGGGKINSLLLNNDLIDEMIISVVPVIIGDGLPLFPDNPKETNLELVDSKNFETGIVNLNYTRKLV